MDPFYSLRYWRQNGFYAIRIRINGRSFLRHSFSHTILINHHPQRALHFPSECWALQNNVWTDTFGTPNSQKCPKCVHNASKPSPKPKKCPKNENMSKMCPNSVQKANKCPIFVQKVSKHLDTFYIFGRFFNLYLNFHKKSPLTLIMSKIYPKYVQKFGHILDNSETRWETSKWTIFFSICERLMLSDWSQLVTLVTAVSIGHMENNWSH